MYIYILYVLMYSIVGICVCVCVIERERKVKVELMLILATFTIHGREESVIILMI